MSRVAVLPGLDPATYQRHALHADDQVWVEKNCYIDIWIETVHALGLDPTAMLGFTVALDFEGDQWTFFKPPHGELYELYGVDVQELNVWRPLLDEAVEHLGAGKLISTEADAWWLPDTAGTDYRTQHTKTTIVLQDLDVEARRLGYFHNASYHQLEGEDFVETFRVGKPYDPAYMPLFAELVRIDRVVRRSPAELGALARGYLRRHLARRPVDNPVPRFAARFARDLGWLHEQGLAFYHAWAFATVRQLGAAFELAAAHLRWLGGSGAAGCDGLEPAAEAFTAISTGCKAFILKAARAVNGKRALDATPMMDELAGAWQRGIDTLVARLDG
ncbi:MAG: DUF1839 family protein [Kofleriaceae bacterium]|nr:DUF1839 family protein [Myxococcales bacterium]MCB9565293.1 DUF1839 family protein [Kofleriaceae bacterium]